MKHIVLVLVSLLVVGLTGCKKDAPGGTDPFLGHWKSETYSYQIVDATGKVTPGGTVSQLEQLDITATTIQFTVVTAGQEYVSTTPYTRTGELLTIDDFGQPGRKTYVRLLTPDSFTLEQSLLNPNGNTIVTSRPFHR